MQNDVLPVFLGATEGAYALCRAFYHDYGICSLVIDEQIPPLFENTKVAAACSFPHVTVPRILERVLEDIHEKGRGKSLLLIPATAQYLSIVTAQKDVLETMFLMPHLPTPCAEQALDLVPAALALLYRSGTGDARVIYGEVCAAASGEPLGVIASPIPQNIEEKILADAENLSRGCYLFYLAEQDDKVVYVREAAPLHPLMAFTTAMDASIPEWMITETVLAEPLAPKDESLCGIFTLFSFRKTKRFINKASRKDAKKLFRRRLATALYVKKGEAKNTEISRIFRSMYRLFAGKTEKTKK